MKTKKFLVVLMTSLMLVGCNKNENQNTNKYIEEKEVAKSPVITLAVDSYAIEVGESWKLEYSLVNAGNAKASFKSNDESIATVSEDGIVTGKGVGDAVISVSYNDISSLCSIKVSANKEYSIFIGVSDITLFQGGEFELQPQLIKNYTEKAEGATFEFKVLDESIAEISNNKLLGKSEGVTSLLVTATLNGKNYYKTFSVLVNPDYYISCANNFEISFSEGYYASFPEIEIRKIDDNSLVTGKDIILESTSNLVEIDNINKKIKLNGLGDVDLTVKCENIKKDVPSKIIVGKPQHDEYVNYWVQDVIDNLEIGGLPGPQRQIKAPNSPILVKNNQKFGGHIGENILHVDMSQSNGMGFKYPGFYIEPRQSLSELEALKLEGYAFVNFAWCREAETVIAGSNGQFWCGYCDPTIAPGWNSKLTSQNGWIWGGKDQNLADLSSWHEMYIPIENIIGCYDDLVNHTKPLFFTSTEDNQNYQLNISEIKFVKEIPGK